MEFQGFLAPFFAGNKVLHLFDPYAIKNILEPKKLNALVAVCNFLHFFASCNQSHTDPLVLEIIVSEDQAGDFDSKKEFLVKELQKRMNRPRAGMQIKIITLAKYDLHARFLVGEWWALRMDKGLDELRSSTDARPGTPLGFNKSNSLVEIVWWPTKRPLLPVDSDPAGKVCTYMSKKSTSGKLYRTIFLKGA